MKKVIFIVPTTDIKQSELKFLHTIYSLDKQKVVEIKVLFLFDSPLRAVLEKYNIQTSIVGGLGGLARFVQQNKVDIIHSFGSKRVLETLLKNLSQEKQIFQHIFEYDPNNDVSDLVRFSNINILIDNNLLKAHYPKSIELFHGFCKDLAISQNSKQYYRQLLNVGADQNLVGYKPTDNVNINFLLQLAKSINQHRFPLQLLLMYEGPLKKAIVQKIQDEGLQNIIIIPSSQVEISACNAYLDIENISSLAFNCLEALVNQLPIITPQNSYSQELIKNKSLGLLIRTLEPDFVARLIFACLQIKSSEIYLPDEYTSEFTINKILQFYNLPSGQNIYTTLITETSKPSNEDYIIIPYGIYGGGEIFLKNHIEQGTFTNPHLLFLANNKLLDLMRDKCSTTLFSSFAELGNFLLKKQAKKAYFYNSASVYNLLCRVRSAIPIQINEIVHSTLRWADSMHTADRRFVNKIFCVSDSVAKEWGFKQYQLLKVIIDSSRFQKPKIPHEGTIIGTVARLSPEKNLKRVVDIAKWSPPEYKFVIVGKDGGSKNELINYINQNNLQQKVIIKDFREDIENEYLQFDAFLLTSHVEGTPITILEAQAANLPVIAPMVGGIREMMKGYSGYVFAPGIEDRLLAKQIEVAINNHKANKAKPPDTQKTLPPKSNTSTPPVNNTSKQEEVIPSNKIYDLVIVSSTDPMLYFHSCLMIAEMLSFLGKSVYTINKQDKSKNYRNEMKLLQQASNILLYRISEFPEEAKQAQKKGIPIGYSIDDDIFSFPSSPIRSVIKSSNYCIANNENLTNALRQLNPNSYCIGPSTYWEELFIKKGIALPEPNLNDNVRIGITYGPAHKAAVPSIIKRLCESLKDLPINIVIVYFLDTPINNISYPNITLEHHIYASGTDPYQWYSKLFSLKLDLSYVSFMEDTPIIRSKSNVKFREASFMKVPLFAADITGEIYKDWIQNGVNGYHMKSEVEILETLKKVITNKDLLKKLGQNSYQTLINITPKTVAQKIWAVIADQNKVDK